MILRNARVFDGTGNIWPRATIYVGGNRILRVVEEQKDEDEQAHAHVQPSIDLAGKTVIPGLINCHTHLILDAGPNPVHAAMNRTRTANVLLMAGNAERTLRAGVTMVRDLGCPDGLDIELRYAINAGLIPGPRMLVAARMICMTGGHGWTFGAREADGPAEVCKAAREQIKAGADVVKLMAGGGVMTPGQNPEAQQLTFEEMRAAIDEAKKASRRTAAHTHMGGAIKDVVRAGIDSIEHANILDDEAIELVLRHGTYLVPTFAAGYQLCTASIDDGVPAYMIEKSKRVYEGKLANFERILSAGVPIAAGNDGGTPFNGADNLAGELELLVGAGFPPERALLAATREAAKLLRMDDQIGSIQAGKLADMVVLGADPLTDIANLRRVERVIKDGVVVDHAR